MLYDAMTVELVEQGSSIFPEPAINPGWDDITKLQWNLGCSVEWLKRYCGPVEIPKIQIKVDDFNEGTKGKFAVIVNGSGMYVDYHTAWRYITHIFDGMRAVYNMKPMDVKFEIPVVLNQQLDRQFGLATLKRGDLTTEMVIRLNEPMPIEMFDDMVYVCFAYKPYTPDNPGKHLT